MCWPGCLPRSCCWWGYCCCVRAPFAACAAQRCAWAVRFSRQVSHRLPERAATSAEYFRLRACRTPSSLSSWVKHWVLMDLLPCANHRRELRTNTGQSNPGRDVDCLRAITAWTASSHTPEGFDCARYCAASNYGCSVAPEGCTKITVVTRLLACSVDFRRSRD